MSDYQMFEAVVRDVEQITPLVKRFTLVSPTGAPLPAFSGGSHIIVQMQDGEQRYSNAYSLMSCRWIPPAGRLRCVLSRLPKAARVLCTSGCARAIP